METELMDTYQGWNFILDYTRFRGSVYTNLVNNVYKSMCFTELNKKIA